MAILTFILVLSILVIVHELGHFLTAKLFKMKVEEFGMGYPPRAWRFWKDKQGTEYTMNWLPFGGFVKLWGEDGSQGLSKAEANKKGAFFSKPVWQRMIVVLAGATVNFVFGVLAFGVIYTQVGIPTQHEYALVEEVALGSPADIAGLEPGDQVIGVEIAGEKTEVTSVAGFIEIVGSYRGETILVELNDQSTLIPVYVRTLDEVPEGEGSIGVIITDFELKQYPMWEMPFRGMWEGLKSSIEFGGMLLTALGDMLGNLVKSGEVPSEVAGPVGIAHAVAKQDLFSDGWMAVLNFAAILSINLAIVNVLPFPALDGGRAVFLVLEALRGKPLKPEVEAQANVLGFAALLLLIVSISVRDLWNVFQDESVRTWWGRFF